MAEISWLDEQLSGADVKTGSLRSQREAWEGRLVELQRLLQSFREAEFDARRSEFSGEFRIDDAMEAFLRGAMSAEQFWSAIRHFQRFAPAWSENEDMQRVFDSDLSRVLGRVLIDVASHALRNAAYRGMQRRSPTRQQQRESTGCPPFRNRGFTNGRGF